MEPNTYIEICPLHSTICCFDEGLRSLEMYDISWTYFVLINFDDFQKGQRVWKIVIKNNH